MYKIFPYCLTDDKDKRNGMVTPKVNASIIILLLSWHLQQAVDLSLL